MIVAIKIMMTSPATAFPKVPRMGAPSLNRAIGKRMIPKTKINAAGKIISNRVDDIGKNDK